MACARRALSSCGYARGCGQSACGMRRCDRVQGAFVRSGWHGTLLRRPACRAHGLGSLHLQLGLWRRRAASCDTLTRGPALVVVHATLRMMPRPGLGRRISTPNALERDGYAGEVRVALRSMLCCCMEQNVYPCQAVLQICRVVQAAMLQWRAPGRMTRAYLFRSTGGPCRASTRAWRCAGLPDGRLHRTMLDFSNAWHDRAQQPAAYRFPLIEILQGMRALQCTALWPRIARATGPRRRRLQGGAGGVCEGLRVGTVVPDRCSRPGCATPETKAPQGLPCRACEA